jgi:hypothetical protein
MNECMQSVGNYQGLVFQNFSTGHTARNHFYSQAFPSITLYGFKERQFLL